MDLARDGAPGQAAPGPEGLAERCARLASMESFTGQPRSAEPAAAAAAAGGRGAAAPAADGTATQSSVQVFDPSGRLVFDDPVPPTFEGGTSEFRYYVLPETGRSANPEG
jgi:hypothetical protein